MKANLRSVIVGLGLLFGALAAPVATPPQATEILAEIKSTGAKATFRRLWSDEPQFDAVLAEIAKGSPEWLAIAQQIRPFTDAAASEGLDYSVARALPVAPERVLRLVGHGCSIERICTSPFNEPERGVAEVYEASELKVPSAYTCE